MEKIDLSGRKFESLTAISPAPDYLSKSGRKEKMWNCVCDCGNKVVVRTHSLLSGHAKSCGCRRSTEMESRRKYDFTGEKIGMLTVKQYLGHDKWECKCECGKTVKRKTNSLKYSKQKNNNSSCGNHKTVDFSGQKIGCFTVIKRVEPYITPTGKKLPNWLCQCECGTKEVRCSSMLRGKKKKY